MVSRSSATLYNVVNDIEVAASMTPQICVSVASALTIINCTNCQEFDQVCAHWYEYCIGWFIVGSAATTWLHVHVSII